MSYSRIPKMLKDLDQWVCCWNNSKAPMSAYEKTSASSVDPKTWAFFEQAEWAVKEGHYDNIGFVFHNNGIVGIDIDDGFADGLMTPLCADIMTKCKSYTEKSRSGRGVHILLKGDLPFDGKNNLKGVEIYRNSRFFIMTGDVLIYDEIIENQEAIDYIVQTYFQNVPTDRTNYNTAAQRIYRPEYRKPIGSRIKLRPSYPPIGNGNRNISLTSLAGAMHSIGYKGKDIYKELTYVNRQVCDPPLGDREIQNICQSVTKYDR